MARNGDSTGDGPSRRTWIGVIGTAFFVAIATAIGAGLGSTALDRFRNEKEPVSYSALEEVVECGTQLFVSGDRATSLASGDTASDDDWESFRRGNSAAVVSPEVVEVSIQGESSRTITLSRIDFTVERRPRLAGAIFVNPCGGPTIGRYLQVALDKDPVQVVNSSHDPEAYVGAGDPSGDGPYKPIRFPWTVSVTDPLLLKIVTTTRRCYCIWRAKITWRSGGKSGVMPIDNGGKGYAVVGGENARVFVRDGSSSSGWSRSDR
jgi:hypothetical protein